jgi:subtilisin family serine protease
MAQERPRVWLRVLLALSAITAVVGGTDLLAQRAAPRAFIDGELLVKFRPQVSLARRNARTSQLSAQRLKRLARVGVDHLRLPPGLDLEAIAAQLRQDPEILAVQPNYVRSVTSVGPPNDPYWLTNETDLWGLRKIEAPLAWATFTWGSEDVVVADIDTGVDYNHPDLAPNMWRNPLEIPGNGIDDDGNFYVDDVFGIDTANDDGNPMDDHGHGTHTAGTIAAAGNNGIGVTGVTWNSKIIACKFLKANGQGSDAAAVECFDYLIDLKSRGVNIRVTSNSWGSTRGSGYPQALDNVIGEAGAAGILSIFAAGNFSSNNDVTPFDPASINEDSIISVAASDAQDLRAGFSNYGATSVDLAAPGVSILSTFGGGYGFLSGTSMATPHVAGVAALLFARNPGLTPIGAKQLILGNVDPIGAWTSLVASGGRLNAFRSLSATMGNQPPTVSVTSPAPGATFVAPATIPIVASASDADGSVTRVEFYEGANLIGSDTTAPYTATLTNVPLGNYTLIAVAVDNAGGTTTSAPVGVSVTPAAGTRLNVAAASVGAIATASSSYGAGFTVSAVNNGDRKGLGWGANGVWIDGTPGGFPDWVEVQLAGVRTIDQIDVFTLQDAFTAPVEPTAAMTSSLGVRDFVVQYWTGGAWVTVPGGSITGNQQVWRTVSFAPVATTRIRVLITSVNHPAGYAYLTELEAYEAGGGGNTPPTASVTSPAAGASFVAPATIGIEATAADTNGSVTRVDFFEGANLIGSDATAPYTLTWANVGAGSYGLTAVAVDNAGATGMSAPVAITVTPPGGARINVAAASAGATAVASSTYSAGFTASAVNNGDRKGIGFGANGVWIDGTPGGFPDWVEVQLAGARTIDQIDVFTLQDAFTAPVEPTTGMISSLGVRDFALQYWTGAAWVTVPGGSITGNQQVWRTVTFAPVTTTRIRVLITGVNHPAGYAYLTELEAYEAGGGGNTPPTASVTSPAPGATFVAPATITVEASAGDTDGTVTRVDFYEGANLIGSDSTAPYTLAWSNVAVGSYTLTAVAVDNGGALGTSAPVAITVTPPGGGRINVAAASAGATAVASSTYWTGFTVTAVNNGDRKGVGWGADGVWIDGTPGGFPDSVEVQLAGVRTIDQIDVFTLQDAFTAPVEPTAGMISTFGVRDFEVQYWTGGAWVTVPGGSITGNQNVWRTITFAPVTTTRIRLLITSVNHPAGYAYLAELEAYGSE